jgi:hypothetical protein
MYDPRMSQRIFLRLLFAFALVFSGSAAQLHSLAHAQADLAAAGDQRGHKAPAPLKHSTDQCLVVHGLDGTVAAPSDLFVASDTTHQVVSTAAARRGESPAAAFQSRAPPRLS